MSSKIYFISGGPGDPGLLTIKGKEILEKADVVIYFKPFNILFKDILKDKEIYEVFSLKFEEMVELIENTLKKNKIPVFLVPGDVSIFSPFSVFLNYFKDRVEIIPGVSSFNYLAAKLNYILNLHSHVHKVVIISTKILKERVGELNLKDFTDKNTVLIIFMNDIPIEKIISELREIYDENSMIHIGIKLSMNEEKIYSFSLHNPPQPLPKIDEKEKFSLIIVTPYSEMELTIDWWNKKVEEYSMRRNSD